MSTTVTFDHLNRIPSAKLRACIRVFQDRRDEFAKEGEIGLADIFATIVAALGEEKRNREKEFRCVVEQSYCEAEDLDDEWTPRL